jgi:hypothetical protein
MTGFYEKVIKVKADVAAVLVSAKQRFGSGGGHCQGRPAGVQEGFATNQKRVVSWR